MNRIDRETTQEEAPDLLEGLPTYGPASAEVDVALEITQRILAREKDAGREIDKPQVFAEVQEILGSFAEERIAGSVDDFSYRLSTLINGGAKAFEGEIRSIENNPNLSEYKKNEQKRELINQYTQAKIMEKMNLVKITNHLLNKFLDPYVSVEVLARETSSQQNDKGQWSSDFEPDMVEKGMRDFVSRKALEEVRAGIQLALQMRSQVNGVLTKHRGYDGRPDAKKIIKEIFGVEILGRVRVVGEGPLSISISISGEADFNLLHYGKETAEPGKESGGFHSSYLDHWRPRAMGDQYSTLTSLERGLINIVKGSFDQDGIINHENEHTLYEILMNNRGIDRDILGDMLKKVPDVSGRDRTQIVTSSVEKLLFEAHHRYIAGFANEAMAYVLNNEDPRRNSNDIIESNFRRLTENKLYEHHHITSEVLKDVQSYLLSGVSSIENSGLSDTVKTEVLDLYKKKAEEVSTRKNFEAVYKSILGALVNLLKAFPDNKNYIRALLAGENPVKWPRIAEAILRHRWKEDAIGEFAESSRTVESKKMKEQLGESWSFLAFFEEDFGNSEETTDDTDTQEAETSYEYDKDKFDIYSFVLGGKVYLIEREKNNKSFYIIRDSKGKKVFNFKIPSSIDREKDIVESGGKLFCYVSVQEFSKYNLESDIDYEGRVNKRIVLKEGENRPIGSEYSDVVDIIFYKGKTYFTFETSDGKLKTINEDGENIEENLPEKKLVVEDHVLWTDGIGLFDGDKEIDNDFDNHFNLDWFTSWEFEGKTYFVFKTPSGMVMGENKIYTLGGEENLGTFGSFCEDQPVYNHLYFDDSKGLVVLYDNKLVFVNTGEVVEADRIKENFETTRKTSGNNPTRAYSLFKIKKGNEEYYLDTKGKRFEKKENSDIKILHDGSVFYIEKVEGKEVLKDIEGNVVVSGEKIRNCVSYENLKAYGFIVKNGNVHTLYNDKMVKIFEKTADEKSDIDYVADDIGGKIIYSTRGGETILKSNGEVLIDGLDKNLGYGDDGYIVVKKDGKILRILVE